MAIFGLIFAVPSWYTKINDKKKNSQRLMTLFVWAVAGVLEDQYKKDVLTINRQTTEVLLFLEI